MRGFDGRQARCHLILIRGIQVQSAENCSLVFQPVERNDHLRVRMDLHLYDRRQQVRTPYQ